MTSFEGKVAVVTGAAAGIGAAVAAHLVERGAKVVLASRSGTETEHSSRHIDPSGNRVLAVETNVQNPESLREMVDRTLDHFGALHLAVNNAGIPGPRAATADYNVEDWNDVISTDLSGIFYSMKFEIPALLRSGGGAIVNLTSANGLVGLPGASAYTAAKHGIVGLTRTAALEYATQGIRVNAVAPGYVDTPRMRETPEEALAAFRASHPTRRLVSLHEVASAIGFLLSDESGSTTGTVLSVDGGYTAQ